MKTVLPLFTLLIISHALFCQAILDCQIPTAQEWATGNNIQGLVNNSGNLFFDGEDASFLVPQNASGPTSTIFSSGFWFGGIDPGGNLKVAANTYGSYGGDADYYPGPLDEEGLTSEAVCKDWDKIWKVYRYQIEAHKADFADNGSINTPIAEIFNWPAVGNGLFPLVEGFDLPTNGTQSLAPFFDQNDNGIYDPLNGDYPLPANVSPEKIPAEITYCLYSDQGNVHSESGGNVIKILVGQTTYSFNCTEESPLNNSLFVSLACSHLSEEDVDSLFVGNFVDFDLGCREDDYIGCDTLRNTFFAYNKDNLDGDESGNCSFSEHSFGENPPVQAVTFLNRKLEKFGHIPSFDSPLGTAFPQSAIEYYRYLSGSWRDGSPYEYWGDGYQEGTIPVNHVFPNDPNNADGWSMLTTNLDPSRGLSIASVKINHLSPNGFFQFDLAYTFVREAGANNLENVTAMYSQVDEIQAMYDNQFSANCAQAAICADDCVWAGDANADGIANHCDLLAIGFAADATGATRNPPYNWSPVDGEAWANEFLDGTNFKHADCDGNGMVAFSDIEKTEQHYGLTNELYDPMPDEYQEGPEMFFNLVPPNQDLENIEPGQVLGFIAQYTFAYPDLRGLAFSVEFDPSLFESISYGIISSTTENRISSPDTYSFENGQIDFATITIDPNEPLQAGNYLLIQFFTKDELVGNSTSLNSAIRFKNIKGIDNQGMPFDLGGNQRELTFIGVNSTKEASKNGFQIYPNPTSNLLTVEFPNKTIESIQIIDLNGKIVLEQQNQFSEKSVLNLGHLPKGIYFLKMENERNTFFQKVSVF